LRVKEEREVERVREEERIWAWSLRV